MTDEIIPEEGIGQEDSDAEEEEGGLRHRWCAGIEIVIRIGGRGGANESDGKDVQESSTRTKRGKNKSKNKVASIAEEGKVTSSSKRVMEQSTAKQGGSKKGKEPTKLGKNEVSGKKGDRGELKKKEKKGNKTKLLQAQRDMMDEEEQNDIVMAATTTKEVDMDDEEMAMNG